MVLQKRFQRRVESFTCINCQTKVDGDGYTNHCPNCLISLHVDISPGDRAASCLGIMEPVSVEIKHGEYIITHKCVRCGHEKPNRSGKEDNLEAIFEISSGATGKLSS